MLWSIEAKGKNIIYPPTHADRIIFKITYDSIHCNTSTQCSLSTFIASCLNNANNNNNSNNNNKLLLCLPVLPLPPPSPSAAAAAPPPSPPPPPPPPPPRPTPTCPKC
uniref:Uncharacterized protein n=1 Tax=Glossina pallidipes TaxID=7398 RepID=A0A1B0ADI3_GLOPL